MTHFSQTTRMRTVRRRRRRRGGTSRRYRRGAELLTATRRPARGTL